MFLHPLRTLAILCFSRLPFAVGLQPIVVRLDLTLGPGRRTRCTLPAIRDLFSVTNCLGARRVLVVCTAGRARVPSRLVRETVRLAAPHTSHFRVIGAALMELAASTGERTPDEFRIRFQHLVSGALAVAVQILGFRYPLDVLGRQGVPAEADDGRVASGVELDGDVLADALFAGIAALSAVGCRRAAWEVVKTSVFDADVARLWT